MKARLPKGYGGGGASDMNQLMRQAQKMQDELAIKQAELDEREHTTTVGGGVVEVTMGGNKVLKSIKIHPDVVDPEDVEMLQDLVVAAVNEVLTKVDETSEAELGDITGGLNMPGLL